MARSSKSSRSESFNFPVKIQVEQPKFELLASVRHLDLIRLSKAARADIELGYVEADDCRQFVHAIIRKGMVTGLQVEPCAVGQSVRTSPELVRLLNATQRRALSRRGRVRRLPVQVSEFFSDASLIKIAVECYVVYIFGKFRLVCCKDASREWVCSSKPIIVLPK